MLLNLRSRQIISNSLLAFLKCNTALQNKKPKETRKKGSYVKKKILSFYLGLHIIS